VNVGYHRMSQYGPQAHNRRACWSEIFSESQKFSITNCSRLLHPVTQLRKKEYLKKTETPDSAQTWPFLKSIVRRRFALSSCLLLL